MASRRGLYLAVRGVPPSRRIDAVYDHLLSVLHVPLDAERSLLNKCRRCASRFVISYEAKINKYGRNFKRFEEACEKDGWLDFVPAYPHVARTVLDDATCHRIEESTVPANFPVSVDENGNFIQNKASCTSIDVNVSSQSRKRVGRPTVSFENASKRTKMRRTGHLRSHTSKEELIFSVKKVLKAEGLHEVAHKISGLLSAPEACNGRQQVLEETSPEEALCLFISMHCSKSQYQTLRGFSLGHKSNLIPPYAAISKAKKACYPEDMQFSEKSAEIPLQSLLNHTASRLFQANNDIFERLPENVQVCVLSKYGMDGSGGHSSYKQKFAECHKHLGTDNKIFMSCLVPVQISSPAEKTWKNPVPSSTIYCRPIKFSFKKETKEVIKETSAYLRKQIDVLQPTSCVLKSGKVINVQHKLELTMVDGKVCNTLMDCSSQSCYLCHATTSDMNSIDEIRLWPVDREALKFSISPLHCKMRCFDALLHIAYKQDIQQYRACGDCDKLVVAARKLLIQEEFKRKMSLIVDVPRSDESGNSNDGNTARRVFSEPKLAAEILGLDFEFIRGLAGCLELLASTENVVPDEYNVLASDTSRRYLKFYDWYPMPPTMHKVLIHGADIIRHAPVPVGQLSEEAMEALNKIVRSYRHDFARKCSRQKTNEDVLKRLLIWSDPVMSGLRRMKKLPTRPVHENVRVLTAIHKDK